MQKGDQICIFFGGKVPHILHQFHTKWILIGECCKSAISLVAKTKAWSSDTDSFLFYSDVHGVMEGEALKKYADGCAELKLEQFCLI